MRVLFILATLVTVSAEPAAPSVIYDQDINTYVCQYTDMADPKWDSHNGDQVCPMRIGHPPHHDEIMYSAFKVKGKTVTLVRNHDNPSQSRWTRVLLNGKPALEYEINRSHFIVSTMDISETLDYRDEVATE